MKGKGIFFTIDGLFALMFIILLVFVFNNHTSINKPIKDLERIKITNKVSDLLLTSQILMIEDVMVLEKNYEKLIEKNGYIIINNTEKQIILNNSKGKEVISQSIKYINGSNKVIYIEIGVYY